MAETFHVVAPSGTPLIIGGIIVVMMLGFAAWFISTLARLNKVRFEVSDSQLSIVAPWYGRDIDRSKLKIDEAKIVNLTTDPECKIKGKKGGLGLPGAKLGNYKLESVEKALIFIAKGEKCLFIPTDDLPLVLETPEAEDLLEALKS